MADSRSLLACIYDEANVVARLDLVFNDCRDDFGEVRAPSDEDARRLLEFVRAHLGKVPNTVFQCQVGIGRSLAAYAAVLKLHGGDPRPALYKGTHNRNLYRKILAAGGMAPDPEPRVSLVARLKYAPDRMTALLLSIQRQRYDNWELVFVSDGPNAAAREVVEQHGDARVRLIETREPAGRWGHPYRQLGIEACTGDLVGLTNDDNYYVPGYFEQMANAIERESADIALCQALHSYWGWRPIAEGRDLGSWIARRELVRRTPWAGDDFYYDAEYLQALLGNAGGRVAKVDVPLFIHN